MTAKFAKINRPQLAQAYPRQRLFSILDNAATRPLTWISANAGAGKTVLMASYLDARHLPYLWYRLDARDCDAATFFYYLREAALQAGIIQANALPLLTGEYVGSEVIFAQNYFAQLFLGVSPPYALIFDNYQDLPDNALLHTLLGSALQEMPAGVQAFVLSRAAPPASFVRLQANQKMGLIDSATMRLNREETTGLLALQSGVSLNDEIVDTIYRETEGWAAGVILLLEHITRSGMEVLGAGKESCEAMFHYFATELFENASSEMRNFLCWTAIAPQFNIEVARQLTAMNNVEELVSELVRKNYFIYQQGESASTYQYHPLFYEFLHIASRQLWSDQEIRNVYRHAAQILLQYGLIEEAVEILQKSDAAEALAVLILPYAQVLLAQGRYHTLQRWIEGLGNKVLDSTPWLRYWYGVSLLPFDIQRSRKAYEDAYRSFSGSATDVAGLFLSWVGVVDTYVYEWGNFAPLDEWIGEFDKLQSRHPQFPTPEIRARAVYAIFCALMYRQPNHPQIGEWRNTVAEMLEGTQDIATQVMLGTHLIFYDIWWSGNLSRATSLRNLLRTKIETESIPPLVRITWYAIEAAYHWVVGANADGLHSVERGLALAESSGIHIWDIMILGQGVWATITDGQLDIAKGFLKRMQEQMIPSRRLDFSHFHYQSYIAAWQAGNAAAMQFHAQESVRLACEAGVPMLEGYSRIGLAWTLRVQGEIEEAEKQFSIARGIGERMHSEANRYCCVLPPLIFLGKKDGHSADLAGWQEAIEVASQQGFVNHPWWREETMARLCAEALLNEVEVAFVKQTIQLRQLRPPQDVATPLNWPMPLKLYTLGRFSILKDDKPVTFTGKAQKRPMELLKVLIAYGGRNVSEETISEALWPEAEGDAAHSTFTTTLSRLRKLLGNEMLQFSDGKLTLNNSLCWVDAWTCERLLGQIERLSHQQGNVDCMSDLMRQLLDYYHGPFLQREGNAWVLSLRERLQSRVLRAINALIQRETDCERKISLYEFALQIDDLAERAYQGLMSCLGAQGRRAEALAVYDRWRNLLRVKFGIEPAAETQQLAASIETSND